MHKSTPSPSHGTRFKYDNTNPNVYIQPQGDPILATPARLRTGLKPCGNTPARTYEIPCREYAIRKQNPRAALDSHLGEELRLQAVVALVIILSVHVPRAGGVLQVLRRGGGTGGGHCWPVGCVHGGRARAAQRARPFMPPQAPAAPPHGGGLGPPRWVLLPLRTAATGQGLGCCTQPENTAQATQGGLPVGCSPAGRLQPCRSAAATAPIAQPIAKPCASAGRPCAAALPCVPLCCTPGATAAGLASSQIAWPSWTRPAPDATPPSTPTAPPTASRPAPLRAAPFDNSPRTRLQVEVLGLCAGRASGDRESAPRPAPAPFASCQGATPANRSWNRDHAARAAPGTHRRRTWR
jgi:hypothetical protein